MLSFVWSRKVGITVDSLLSLATLCHMFTDFLSCVAPLATQRPICLILVMDGFSVDTIFGPRSWTVRPAGWTIQFTVWIYESLSDKDERIVSYATLESMLSPFMLAPGKWQTLPFTWKCLWARCMSRGVGDNSISWSTKEVTLKRICWKTEHSLCGFERVWLSQSQWAVADWWKRRIRLWSPSARTYPLFSGGMLSILAMVNETLSGDTPFLNGVY